jgi:CarD family transcriptional regulator
MPPSSSRAPKAQQRKTKPPATPHDARGRDHPQASKTERRRRETTIPATTKNGRTDRKFTVGDAVVYPHHGVGTVVQRSSRELAGARCEYLTIEIQSGHMTLMLPTKLAAHVGLRPIASPAELHRALEALGSPPESLSDNWKTRRKQALSKLGSGEVALLAEVIRDLAQMSAVKSLADNDRQLYAKARGLLESELKVALGTSETHAAAEVDRRLLSS